MDIHAAEQQTIDQLDSAYQSWAASLTQAEIAALRCYQSSERAYRLVNGVLRGSIDPSTLDAYEAALAAEVIIGVSSALSKGALGNPVTVWRGVRSLEATFGAPPAGAATLVGTRRRLAGFASCTAVKSVAEEVFTDSGAGALLRIEVPAGVQGAWLPLMSDPDYEDEYEFLLEDDLVFEVKGVQEIDGILVLDCEVRQ